MASHQQDPHHRHKRTYDEMSQPQSSMMSSISSFLRPLGSPSPVDNTPIFVERYRTSHPHNPQPPRSNFFAPAREAMASQQQSFSQPSLTHQASQTVIDLTDDVEELNPAVATENFMRGYPRPPPQLVRSDRSRLGDIIDLTDDIEEEIEITLARPVTDRPTAPRPTASIRDALLMDRRDPHRHRHRHRHRHNNNDQFEDAYDFGYLRQADDHHPGDFLDRYRLSRLIGDGDFRDSHEYRPAVLARPAQVMPHALDYAINAFHIQPPPPPAPQQKPSHQVPSAARKGFTRSPTENDIIICPGCEEELVSKRGEDDQPVLKKGNRAPSRKEREEHPFWVVRDCGHVYCNKCFQHRKPDKKTTSVFPESTKESSKSKGRALVCAVDGCDSEVSSKDKWVGVFI